VVQAGDRQIGFQQVVDQPVVEPQPLGLGWRDLLAGRDQAIEKR
jgi:hypothetical protein